MSRWFWPVLFVGFFIIAAIIYAPSLGGPWQYDDYAQILDEKVLTSRDLGKLLPSLFRFTAWPDGWTGTRDFVRATFWLNWKWWGLEPAGYRWVNLGIHVGNALLVAVLVAELLGGALSVKRQASSRSSTLAALAGLLFLIHPVQSQAVAYVAQRFTSVATMGYLGAVVAFIKSIKSSTGSTSSTGKENPDTRDTRGTRGTRATFFLWYSLSLFCALVAYNSKEITVTLPAALVLVTVFRGVGSKESGVRNLRSSILHASYSILLLLPFFLLALKIPLQVVSASTTNLTADPEKIPSIVAASISVEQKNPPPTKLEYFLTEQNVMRTYLRLLVLPIRQTLDYDYKITKQWDAGTVASGLLHLGLIGVGGWLLLFHNSYFRIHNSESNPTENTKYELLNLNYAPRLIGAGLLWFYATVGIESSFIAIPDVIYEHRVYLPFVGFVFVIVGGISEYVRQKSSDVRFGRRPSFAALYILLTAYSLLLAAATFRRAAVWGNEVRLWKDVYEKAPGKPRAVKNYGVVLAASGKYEQGIELLKKAVAMDPDNADYSSNLGTAYLRSGQFPEAAPRFKKAYELALAEAGRTNTPPAKETAQYISDYGVALVQMEQAQEAYDAFTKAIEHNPELYAAHLGLGAAKNLLGDLDGAADIFRRLTEEFPEQWDAYGNLATILTKQGRLQEALAVLLKLKKLNPSYEGLDNRIATVNRLLIQRSD